ncbi:hypothetical protein [Clostridium kluyveri]|uniref:hypothetical protein n=1 Tax=Clostridium kluyveri TaxID=1534 RepID=UPI0022459773|nr:hypothetical protein [Clostridium kluyveri]UZQ52756.1 hypothetical protein OP486_16230 [Clostridium kluyveri]
MILMQAGKQLGVQSYISGYEVFGERMFRYFYRIWDRFRYKYNDKSEIIAAAVYRKYINN